MVFKSGLIKKRSTVRRNGIKYNLFGINVSTYYSRSQQFWWICQKWFLRFLMFVSTKVHLIFNALFNFSDLGILFLQGPLRSAIHTFSIRKSRNKIASKLFHFSNFCEIVQNHSVYKYFYSLAPSVKCDDYIGRKNHQVLGSYRHGP